MSSASSGRYQSRLFNFIHQQSRRVTEQCQSALRHVRVATSWVAPVLLYPLYLLFKSTTEAGRQLHQSVQSRLDLPADDTDSQLQTSPTADTPIQRVLLSVNTLPLEQAVVTPDKPRNFLASLASRRLQFLQNKDTSTSSLPHPKPPNVRGIATQLLSRTLVLVTAQNEILDILTLQQQQKLQKRIIEEVAQYWRYQRLAYAATALPSANSSANPTSLIPFPTQTLAFLDRTFAELESNHLASVSKVAITLGSSWKIVQQLKIKFNVQLHSNQLPATADGSENQTFRIQALIWAAIDYFFGNRSQKPIATTSTPNSGKLETGSTPRKPLPARNLMAEEFSPQLPPHLVSDINPWLTLSDLFGEPEPEGKFSQQKTLQAAGKTNLALPFSKLATLLLTQTRKIAKTAATATPPLAASTTTRSSISALQPESAEEICSQSCSRQHEPAAEWIEIDAVAIGYIKHPLEQLLEWLDRFMLWLEEVLMIVGRWISSFIQRVR